MIRTLTVAFAFTAFLSSAFTLLADDKPQKESSNSDIVKRLEKLERENAELTRTIEQLRKQLAESQNSTTDTAAEDPKVREIQNQLNGTWKIIVYMKDDYLMTYDQDDYKLVIRDDEWALFVNGQRSRPKPKKCRVLPDTDPVSYVLTFDPLTPPDDGPHLSFGILKIDGDHLMLTEAGGGPANHYRFRNVYDGNEDNDYPGSELFPKGFSVDGTMNQLCILRRVSDATELLDQPAKRSPYGAPLNESEYSSGDTN